MLSRRSLLLHRLHRPAIICERASGQAGELMSPWTESLLGGSTTAPWIDVKTYGAKGDGVTDDTAAIQAALDGRPSTGAVIYFPAGTYLITASLSIKNPRIMLVGAGTDITLIKAGANIATALIANASGIQGFTVYM